MSQRLIYRVKDDDGPAIFVQHRGVNVNGWTITARFVKPSGVKYTSTATITVDGDPGADVAAEYNFAFASGNLSEAGDHLWDIHYAAATIDDYSIPARDRFVMRVRD